MRRPVPLSMPGSIELPCDQLPVPSQDRPGFDDGDDISHQFAKGDSLFCKNDTLGVGQEDTLLDLVAQDTVLFDEIFNPEQERFLDFELREYQSVRTRSQMIARSPRMFTRCCQ